MVPGLRQPAPRLTDHDLTSRGVIALGGSLLAACTALQVWLSEHLGLFFGLCFVLASLTTALLVRLDGFFAVGVLPPVLMLLVLAVVALVSPGDISSPGLDDDAGFAQRIIAGVVAQVAALVVGHVTVLAVIAARARVLAGAD